MKPCLFLLATLPVAVWGDDSVSVTLRGKTQTLARLQPANHDSAASVIVLPGDGGWRGAAVSMARTITSWGYEVFGFDTKKYLEGFSQDGANLSREQMTADMRAVAGQVGSLTKKRVILVGWSQGAGMAVAAASDSPARGPVHGVVTLGLPQSAVLGWDWKATLAVIARREPDQPSFAMKPLLPRVAPRPLWMIHGTQDEYTTPEVARGLFNLASEPKRIEEIPGANHRFDGHQDEFYSSLKKGLAWIGSQ